MPEMFLTVEQTAARLQLSPLTVQRQLKRGALRGVKRGGVWRVPESALNESSPLSDSPTSSLETQNKADAILTEMRSGDRERRNAALLQLLRADAATRTIVEAVAAHQQASYAGAQEDLSDWRVNLPEIIPMKLTLLVQPDTTPDGKPGFSSLCPELDIASQGETEDEARANLREALELFLEDADKEEVARRLANGARVTQLELAA